MHDIFLAHMWACCHFNDIKMLVVPNGNSSTLTTWTANSNPAVIYCMHVTDRIRVILISRVSIDHPVYYFLVYYKNASINENEFVFNFILVKFKFCWYMGQCEIIFICLYDKYCNTVSSNQCLCTLYCTKSSFVLFSIDQRKCILKCLSILY